MKKLVPIGRRTVRVRITVPSKRLLQRFLKRCEDLGISKSAGAEFAMQEWLDACAKRVASNRRTSIIEFPGPSRAGTGGISR